MLHARTCRQLRAIPCAGLLKLVDGTTIYAQLKQVLAIAHQRDGLEAVATLEVDGHGVGVADLLVLYLAFLLDEGPQHPHPGKQRLHGVKHLCALGVVLQLRSLGMGFVHAALLLNLVHVQQLVALAHATGADEADGLAAAR